MASPLALKKLVKSVLKNGSPKDRNLRWNTIGGITYRSSEGKLRWKEIPNLSQSTGSAVATPTGNGTSGDGGIGVIQRLGNGTSGDGGNGLSKTGGNGTSGDGGHGQSEHLDPMTLDAGMEFQGQHVLAFRVHRKKESVILNASVATLGLVEMVAGKLRLEPLPMLASIGETLRNRLQERMGAAQGEVNLVGRGAECSLHWNADGLRVEIQKAGLPAPITVETSWVGFRSLVALDSTQKWVADLTELFYLEPSNHRVSPWGGLNLLAPPAELLQKTWVEIQSEQQSFWISVRPKDLGADELGQEIVCTFEKIGPLQNPHVP
jgi:hypothetical protein